MRIKNLQKRLLFSIRTRNVGLHEARHLLRVVNEGADVLVLEVLLLVALLCHLRALAPVAEQPQDLRARQTEYGVDHLNIARTNKNTHFVDAAISATPTRNVWALHGSASRPVFLTLAPSSLCLHRFHLQSYRGYVTG